LRFEGWEYLHQAEEGGRGVVFVGMRPAGWEFALFALGRYGMPVTLATVTLATVTLATPGVEDDLLLADHRRVENSLVSKVAQGLDPVCAAFLGVDGEPGTPGGPNQLKVALEQGAAVIPLFALREGRGWRLVLWQSAVFKERTTSKKEQALEWMHRICMQAAEAEARRLSDD
jgi:lauroyl/myristoyl acyltransferase